MEDEILTTYCLCDELLQAVGHRDDPQCQMSSSEVMTIALVAALHFGGNFAKARRWLHCKQYMPVMLSRSRFSRRLHRISRHFVTLFELLAQLWQDENDQQLYVVDTFPIPVCENIRISRCRIYPKDTGYHGYKASKRCYFYGLKLHLITTQHGHPVEFMLSPGGMGDVTGLYGFDFDLPKEAIILADAAYNMYWFEDVIEQAGPQLWSVRKKNSKRPHPTWKTGALSLYRQQVETAGSLIDRLLPHSIHATDDAGFELKVVLFVVAFSIDRRFKVAT